MEDIGFLKQASLAAGEILPPLRRRKTVLYILAIILSLALSVIPLFSLT